MIRLCIIEPNAHKAGHYSGELRQFSLSLQHFNVRTTILTPFGFRESWDAEDNVDVITALGSWPNESPNYMFYNGQWAFYKAASSHIRRLAPDLVHVWGYTSVFPLWYHFRTAPAPVVITLKAVLRPHCLARSRALGAIQEEASLFLLRHTADAFIVHTTQLFDEACSVGIPQRRLSVIPGCGVAGTGTTSDAEQTRKAMLLPGKKFVLLAFGVQREDKGILELLEWMREVPDDVHLVIAGEDWTEGRIRDAVDRYGIGHRVSLLLRYFHEDEMRALFHAADAVVICHRPGFSGESGVLYHALEGRIPILASIPGHAAEFVREHELGGTFEFGDPKSFLQAILRLQNETEAERRGRVETQARLSRELSWPKISGKYFELYASLLSRPSDQGKG